MNLIKIIFKIILLTAFLPEAFAYTSISFFNIFSYISQKTHIPKIDIMKLGEDDLNFFKIIRRLIFSIIILGLICLIIIF